MISDTDREYVKGRLYKAQAALSSIANTVTKGGMDRDVPHPVNRDDYLGVLAEAALVQLEEAIQSLESG